MSLLFDIALAVFTIGMAWGAVAVLSDAIYYYRFKRPTKPLTAADIEFSTAWGHTPAPAKGATRKKL